MCSVIFIGMQINIVLIVNWSGFSDNACTQSNVQDHEGETTCPGSGSVPLFFCVCHGLMIIISAWNRSGLHEIIRSQKGVNTVFDHFSFHSVLHHRGVFFFKKKKKHLYAKLLFNAQKSPLKYFSNKRSWIFLAVCQKISPCPASWSPLDSPHPPEGALLPQCRLKPNYSSTVCN